MLLRNNHTAKRIPSGINFRIVISPLEKGRTGGLNPSTRKIIHWNRNTCGCSINYIESFQSCLSLEKISFGDVSNVLFRRNIFLSSKNAFWLNYINSSDLPFQIPPGAWIWKFNRIYRTLGPATERGTMLWRNWTASEYLLFTYRHSQAPPCVVITLGDDDDDSKPREGG